jgi:hypothetical protein
VGASLRLAARRIGDLCQSVPVKALNDDGAVLDAEYHAEPNGRDFAVVLESRGGGEAGSSPPRNPDYDKALSTLLRRLASLDAVLVDALVDSTLCANRHI